MSVRVVLHLHSHRRLNCAWKDRSQQGGRAYEVFLGADSIGLV
jgi:hypothetical protein